MYQYQRREQPDMLAVKVSELEEKVLVGIVAHGNNGLSPLRPRNTISLM